MRVYTAKVPDRAAEKTLESYLAHAMPLIPPHVLRDAFARRDVKVNGQRAGARDALTPGALVQVYTHWDAALPVVYEDGQVLILHKPAGISCEEDGRGGMTVRNLLEGRTDRPQLCHRLDNQTSGLLVAAKTAEAAACLDDAFRTRGLTKRYECIVKGRPNPDAMTAEAFIIQDPRLGRMRVVTHGSPEAKKIITAYETLRTDGKTSRLLITLLTGRTHQIRAHMAALQHPLLGDDLYGDRAFNQQCGVRRLMLCATAITFSAGGVLGYLDGRTFHIDPPF